MRARCLLCVALLLIVPAASAAAAGMGGVGVGAQYYDAGLSSANNALTYITGFGYATSGRPEAARIGGFGMAILSTTGMVDGGVGGMLVGREVRSGPLVSAVTAYLGTGGVSFRSGGYMVVFGELEVEIGVRFMGMQLSPYAGFQAWGNLIPGTPLAEALVYTPVLGVRMAWGG